MRSARDLGPEDLVWDHFSRPRHDDPVGRVFAAAAAGYAGIGLYVGAWAAMRDDAAAVGRLDAALDETGLCVADIEVVRGWAGPGGPTDDCLALEALAWDLADRFGCRYLQAIGDPDAGVADTAIGFGALCDRAAEHGLLVGLEWVPSLTSITTAPMAAEVVDRADRPNGGLCADIWHLTRSGGSLDDLAALPGRKIFATQLNDGTLLPQDPDYVPDCLANRVPPGDGEFDVVGFVRTLDAVGSTAPIGLEVCSTRLWGAPVDRAAAESADGMRRILATARA